MQGCTHSAICARIISVSDLVLVLDLTPDLTPDLTLDLMSDLASSLILDLTPGSDNPRSNIGPFRVQFLYSKPAKILNSNRSNNDIF
jgi:hypothetical protein